jgi:hypothetical protein
MVNGEEIQRLLAAHPRLWLVAGALGLWFAIATARKVFDGSGGFLEALRYWFQPGWLSFLRGEFMADQWAQFKLMGWLVFSVVVTLLLKTSTTWLVIHYGLVQKWHLPV